MLIPLSHLYSSSRGSTTQKMAANGDIPRKNRTDRNQNVNLSQDDRSLPPTKIFVEPPGTAA